jgi:hypothetical protein
LQRSDFSPAFPTSSLIAKSKGEKKNSLVIQQGHEKEKGKGNKKEKASDEVDR